MSETEIPADIRSAAERIAHLVGAVQDSAEEIIASALLTERRNSAAQQREKDARIAETVEIWKRYDGDFEGNCIASAIRGDGNG